MKKLNREARYYETNEWIVQNKDQYTIGITDFGQTVFGNIVFVELPEIGDSFQQGQTFAVTESNKCASDLTMPMSGKILAVNPQLLSHPELLNEDPYLEGWLIKITASHPEEWDHLMTAEQYLGYIGVFFNKL